MLTTIIDKIKEMDTDEFTVIFITTAITAIIGIIIIAVSLCNIVSSICGVFGGPIT